MHPRSRYHEQVSSSLCDSRKGFSISYSMQIVYYDEDEECSSRRVGAVDAVIYTGRVSRYLEIKHYRIFKE